MLGVGQVTAMLPPIVGITVGGAPVVVVVAFGGAVEVTATVGDGAGGGAGRAVGGSVRGVEVGGEADADDGSVTAGTAVAAVGPGATPPPLADSSVVEETANGASARSTSRGETTESLPVVIRVSTPLTAAHASPLVTAVPRIHAPTMAIRVRTAPVSSAQADSPRRRASNHS